MRTSPDAHFSDEEKPLTKLGRKWLRFKLKWQKRLDSIAPPKKLNENQALAISAIKKLIRKPDTLLLVAPISQTRYMHLVEDIPDSEKKKEIFATIEGSCIRIINGKYSYDIWIPEKSAGELKNIFDQKVERIRKKMENEIFSKRNRSLQDICNELSL